MQMVVLYGEKAYYGEGISLMKQYRLHRGLRPNEFRYPDD